MTLAWSAVFVGGLVVGLSVVALLVLRRNQEFLALVLCVAGIAIETWGLLRVADVSRPAHFVMAIGLSLATLGGGYALASSLLPYLAPRGRAYSLPDSARERFARPAVLLVGCVEPERYSPALVTAELERLASAELPETTVSITPFLYAAQKARYRAMGGASPSLRQATALAERLESELGEWAESVRLVSCLGPDTLDRAVTQAAVRGACRIVVAGTEIGESYQVDRAKSVVDALRPERHGVRLAYTPPLWGSEELATCVADTVWHARDASGVTGVALVLHGQPDAWERTHSSFDVHENSFANRIRSILAHRGIEQDRVRLCFAEWRPPDVTETVRHLAALGCTRILVCPAVFPFDTSVTLLDMQVGVRQARVDAHVSVITLGAWGRDETASGILAAAVRRCAAELGEDA